MKRPDHFLLLLGIWGTREALKERDLALAARCVIGTALAALIVGAVYLCPRPTTSSR